MLTIVLLIIKIILIIIAVILGILLLALLAVLFVPIRYKLGGRYNDTAKYAFAKCSWLLHILSVKVEFDKDRGLDFAVRLFGIRLNKKKDKDSEERSVFDETLETDGSNEASESAEKVINDRISKADKNNRSDEADKLDNMSGKLLNKELESKEPVKDKLELNESAKDASESKTDTFSSIGDALSYIFTCIPDKVYDWISDRMEQLGDKFSGIKNKIISIKDKIFSFKDNTREKIDKVKAALNNKRYRELAKFIWIQIKALWKIIKPRKGRLYVHYGFDDPETTGKVTMYLAILYGIMGVDINICPDFKEKVLEADGMLKGQIRLIGVVIILIRCYMNKNFRRYILKRKK